MSAKQRLDRLLRLRQIAMNLHRSIIDECDIVQAEVAAIDKQIAESEKRCEALEDMVTWDGEQPDFWAVGGKTWRRCTAADVGKTVRVNNKPECKPNESPEAKLVGIAKGWYCCEGSKGQMVTWRRAWIECDSADETEQPEDETKGYISIQVGSFYPGEPSLPVVKQSLTTEPAPTGKEDLRTEHGFQVGDIVRRKQDHTIFAGWVGKITGVEGDGILVKYHRHTWSNKSKAKNYELVESKPEHFCFESETEPAQTVNQSFTVKPQFKVGDRVRVRKPKEPGDGWMSPEMDIYDGGVYEIQREWGGAVRFKNCLQWAFRHEWLELAEDQVAKVEG